MLLSFYRFPTFLVAPPTPQISRSQKTDVHPTPNLEDGTSTLDLLFTILTQVSHIFPVSEGDTKVKRVGWVDDMKIDGMQLCK